MVYLLLCEVIETIFNSRAPFTVLFRERPFGNLFSLWCFGDDACTSHEGAGLGLGHGIGRLSLAPFEPIEEVPVKFVTLKPFFFSRYYVSQKNRKLASPFSFLVMFEICTRPDESFFIP